VYMFINIDTIPESIIDKYKLRDIVENGKVVMEVSSTIYGLKEAGKLSQDRLVAHLSEYGYKQCRFTPCLFIHESNGAAFTLVVDDFLVKFQNQTAADHLIETLRKLYEITIDTAPTQKYIGITLEYNRDEGYLDMSMPGYIKNALTRFGKLDVKGANSPIIYVPPVYGATTQTIPEDKPTGQSLDKAQVKLTQEIIGVFLYYARSVDPMMFPAVNKLATRLVGADTSIFQDTNRLFQYASRWLNAKMRVHASDMKLKTHSDASYLSETKARSRAGGFFFLGDCEPGATPNAPVAYLSTIITTVVDSAAAAEYAALFICAQFATSLRLTLAELGYPQTATPITCDNECAVGIANKSLTQKRSKTIDMRYHWVQDQVSLGNFTVNWAPGKWNLADFFTKAHPVHHHVSMMKIYLLPEEGVLM